MKLKVAPGFEPGSEAAEKSRENFYRKSREILQGKSGRESPGGCPGFVLPRGRFRRSRFCVIIFTMTITVTSYTIHLAPPHCLGYRLCYESRLVVDVDEDITDAIHDSFHESLERRGQPSRPMGEVIHLNCPWFLTANAVR